MRKQLFALTTACLASGALFAQQGPNGGVDVGNPIAYAGYTPHLIEAVVVETFAVHAAGVVDPGGNILPGSVTYRVYLDMLRATDFVTAVGAAPGCSSPMQFSSSNGFYNNSFGGQTAQAVNPGLFTFFPGSQFDSWATFRAENSVETCNSNSTSFSPGAPSGPVFGTNPGINLNWSDAGWFTLNAANPCGFGSGPNNLLLIAQFTTNGTADFTWSVGSVTVVENAVPGQGQVYYPNFQPTCADFGTVPLYLEDATCIPGWVGADLPSACSVSCVEPPLCVDTASAAYAQVLADDPFCCDTQWDGLCQDAYDALNGSCACTIGVGCTATVPLCVTDIGAYNIVVADDPFCCNNTWDSLCANAYNALSNSCTSEACVVTPPSCVTDNCAYAAVVADDPFCCSNSWDSFCQAAYDALSSSCLGCTDPAALNYNPNAVTDDGSCTYCAVAPACVTADDAAYQQILAQDPFCCNNSWDSLCQSQFDAISNSCVCGNIGLGCAVTPPACVTDCNAWQTVVTNDPFCCNSSWDSFCEAAYALLSNSCDVPTCTDITINMFDSFGDGWNGAQYIVTDLATNTVVAQGTLPSGAGGSNIFCLEDGCYSLEVTGGTFPSEVSWDLVGADSPLSGGAPSLNNFSVNTSCGPVCVAAPACVDTNSSAYLTVITNDPFCCNNTWDSICQNAYDNLSLTCTTPCDNAIAIGCGTGSVFGSTTGVINDNSTSGAGTCVTTVGTTGQVWYAFTPDVSGSVTLTTCSPNTNFDTKLHVYTGSCGAFTCVTGNDDDASCAVSGLHSTVSFVATAFTTYYVRVGGFNTAAGNFELTITCPVVCNANSVTLDKNDSFGDGWNGTTYTITNLNTASVVASGTLASGSFGQDDLCLEDGCYNITLAGGTFPSEVSWTLNGVDGGSVSGGAPASVTFSINTSDCEGCTDAAACNYNASSLVDNGSCVYPGCTDSGACNYDATAGCDDGSCVFPGCTDAGACNYDATAGCDDGSCVFPGCTDPNAFNYDPTAGCDDGSCICAPVPACVNTAGADYATVIANDPFCCSTMWDSICQNAYDALNDDCFVPCAVTPPGCVDTSSACYQSVIAFDTFCCNNAWDALCQSQYDGCSATCTGVPAGIPLAATAYPGCNQVVGTTSIPGATTLPSFGPFGGNPDDDVVYTFSIPCDGAVKVVVDGFGIDAVVELFDNNSNLIAAVDNDLTTGGTEILFANNLSAGSYSVRIYDYFSGVQGGFGVCVTYYCASTVDNPYNTAIFQACDVSKAQFISLANSYEWLWVGQNTNQVLTYNSVGNNTWLPLNLLQGGQVQYGETYDVYASAVYSDVDLGTVVASSPNPNTAVMAAGPVSQLATSDQNSTKDLGGSIKSTISCGSDGYVFQLTSGSTVLTGTILGTTVMPLCNIPGILPGQTYSVQIAVIYNNVTYGFGPAFSFNTAPYAPVSLRTQDICANAGAVSLNYTIWTNAFRACAKDYTWEFTDVNGGLPIYFKKGSGVRNVKLSDVSGLTPGESYNVRVKAEYGNFTGFNMLTGEPQYDYATSYGSVQTICLIGPATAEASIEEGAETVVMVAGMYPNPTSDFVNISISNVDETADKVLIDIYDVFGKLVYSEQYASQGVNFFTTISLNDKFATGLYMVNVKVNETNTTLKLTVTR